ncbi:gamma-glutamyltransferase [Solirubrobacter ginsenosidimutans]|uniref:Glutathione hydrolase proenzyme n=1 Tax=Solirubrobacter ginsenosidimutans TaxID=490573 RepID=A0A9X3MN16_9ACTN|nr:gamma-glutamyltransferase [Solirubrobacter ginsenosidimutans]MDA0159130.1 gamma-glutamyltransferase [Solirubrobacter ginsenosidimutans]
MMRLRWLPVGAAMAVVALSAPPARAQDKQPTATGTGGAAASVDPLATNAAIDVLSRGGNAFDAAIAAASVLGVVEPYSCGIGGGGFMTIRDGRSGKITTLDSRETAPQKMVPNSFFINGVPPTDAQFPINRYSGLSTGVPGTPALWDYVLHRYGTYSLGRALAYGANVARKGFTVDQTFFDQTTPNAPYFDDVPSTAAIYLDADGTPHDVGTTVTNPDLAKTYELLGRYGTKRAFYRGPIGEAIVKAADTPPLAPTADHTWRPGLLEQNDLKHYNVIPREPVHINYRGNDIYGMPPASSGGTTDLEALNIMQSLPPAANSTETLYRYLEASRLAYADRNAFLGDPAFVDNPIAGLLDPGYAAQQASRIGPTAPPGPVAAGNPPTSAPGGSAASIDRVGSTTHLSVADKNGNVVSYTFTIEQTGGNGIVVPGYGFLLNNELTDFDITSPNLDAPNAVRGGKRPRSSIAPTIVTKGDKPFFTVGSPGGASIITTVLQTIVNRIDLGMSLPDSIAAPRASQRNSATTEAESSFVNSPDGQALLNTYKEAYRAPAGDEIGAATGIEFGQTAGGGHGGDGDHGGHGGHGDDGHGGHGGNDNGHGHGGPHGRAAGKKGGGNDHGGGSTLTFTAVAEPKRRGGGAAAVVKPGA